MSEQLPTSPLASASMDPDTLPVPVLPPNHLYFVALFAYRTTDMKADINLLPKMASNDGDAFDGLDQINLQAHPLADDWAGHMVQAVQVPDEVLANAYAQMGGVVSMPVRAPWESAPLPTIVEKELTAGGLQIMNDVAGGINLPKVPPIPKRKNLVLAFGPDVSVFG